MIWSGLKEKPRLDEIQRVNLEEELRSASRSLEQAVKELKEVLEKKKQVG